LGHEFVEHTAELALRVWADGRDTLYAEACRAVGTLLLEEVRGREAAARSITVEAVDAEALLVDLLNELIYLAETERWAPESATVVTWAPTRVVLEVAGRWLEATPSRLKSATHHGLSVRPVATGWEAEVIFDV
jgi:SHS2 domain-containing protein